MLDRLIEILAKERNDSIPTLISEKQKRDYFRALCNVRSPKSISEEFLKLQDKYLKQKTVERNIFDVNSLEYSNHIALWQGDITRLKCDAIVNAGNAALLGCFQPLHNCIDNIIHSNAGVQVRLDCQNIMQGKELPNGEVKVTAAYNLPSNYIFHTVGPIVTSGLPTAKNITDLNSCYLNCLEKAREMQLDTIAFCCLSTGVYGYPKQDAAKLAIKTVKNWLNKNQGINVIFNVFLDEDRIYYEQELSK